MDERNAQLAKVQKLLKAADAKNPLYPALRELTALVADMLADEDDLSAGLADLDDFVQSIDADLSELEDTVYGDEDEEEVAPESEAIDGDIGDETLSYDCPHCEREISITAKQITFEDEPLCPYCGKPLFPEVSLEEDNEADEPSPKPSVVKPKGKPSKRK